MSIELTKQEFGIVQRIVPKAEIPVSAKVVADQLLEIGSSLEAFVRLHNLTAILEAAKDLVKEQALVQVGGVKTTALGAEVIAKRMPCRWDYHEDTVIANLESDLSGRKKMLQNLPKEMVDPQTGELAQPATKIEGGETLQIKF